MIAAPLARPVLPLRKVAYVVNTIYVIGLFGGSVLNIGIPILSLLNIFLFPSLIINLVLSWKHKFYKKSLSPMFFLVIYLLFVIIGTITISVEDRFKPMIYQFHLINIFLLSIRWPEFVRTQGVKIARVFLILWLVWALIQFGILIGILPSTLSVIFNRSDKVDSIYGALQISGPFINSNDLACIVLLTMLYVIYFSEWKLRDNLFFYIGGILIVMALSRTAVVLYIGLVLAMAWVRRRLRRMLKSTAWFFMVVVLLIATESLWHPQVESALYSQFGHNAITINFNRMMSILDFMDGKHQEDHSASYRTETYKYAICHLPFHLFGSGYQNYIEFYKNGEFTDPLVWVNPHSFLIEIGIAYGLPSILSFILFLATLCINMASSTSSKSKKRYFYVLMIYTVILSNIPSSILLIPLFWLPICAIYAQSKFRKSNVLIKA